MRIGFEASNVVGKKPTGVAIYIRNFIQSIVDLQSDDQLKIFYKASRLKKRNSWLDIDAIPSQIYLGSVFPLRKGVDIIHGLDTFVPNWKSCKKFVTFHDIVPLLYKDELISAQEFRLKKERDYQISLTNADHIITVSENTKTDLIQYFQVAPEKITSIYPGVDADFFVRKNETEIEKIRQIYGLQKDYLLFVGTISGRKNTARLAEAFARSKAREDFQLVLAGAISYKGELTLEAIEKNNLGKRVKILGYIENEHLPALYSGAHGFLFPTIYEGFGFPVLESLLCETPVLTSNVGSSPEIGGKFAKYVEPNEIESIAEGIDRLIVDKSFDGSSAREYASRFTWKRSAEKMLKTYRDFGF